MTESSSGGASGAPAETPTCYRHPDRETWIRCQRCDRPICPDCMRSAAVGFQCPDCVKDGAKQTRQGRTPYGGQRVGDPRQTTFVLIAINALVWFAIQGTGSRLVQALGLLPQTTTFVDNTGQQTVVEGVSGGAYWQVVTSMFTQVAVLHIAFNMLALYFLGPTLESVLGRARFLAVYLGAGLLGSASVMVFASPHTSTVGASGAIFGLMGALAVVAVKVGGQAQQVLLWIGINLVLTFTLSGISWQGHLGGLLGGVLLGAAMVYAPRQQRSIVQWGAVAAVVAVAAGLIVVRAAQLA